MEDFKSLFREYRMYGLVPYNLSPIQQGIQFGHAVVEYGLDFFETEEYQEWARRDKTFIILNGGTTNDNNMRLGTLQKNYFELTDRGIKVGEFHEPDLGDQMTAVVFIVDDRVFDKVNWPDYEGDAIEEKLKGRSLETQYYEWKMKFAKTEKEADQIVFLREFLKNFRLA
jgi:hypothetical protein